MLDKFHKRLLELFEIVTVCLHVVGIDIGDHSEYRLQVQERGIGFVGLDDDKFARAEFGIAVAAIQFAADHKGGIESAPGQYTGS